MPCPHTDLPHAGAARCTAVQLRPRAGVAPVDRFICDRDSEHHTLGQAGALVPCCDAVCDRHIARLNGNAVGLKCDKSLGHAGPHRGRCCCNHSCARHPTNPCVRRALPGAAQECGGVHRCESEWLRLWRWRAGGCVRSGGCPLTIV